MSDYTLVYIKKNDSRIYHAKRIIAGHYSLRDPITGEKIRINRRKLTNEYEFQKDLSMSNVRKSTRVFIEPKLA